MIAALPPDTHAPAPPVVSFRVETRVTDLRLQVAQLRQELTATTQAYHNAVSERDLERTIPLLRSRSQLMRRLLDTQCELLLSMRCQTSAPGTELRASR